jgi:hypothetical protein
MSESTRTQETCFVQVGRPVKVKSSGLIPCISRTPSLVSSRYPLGRLFKDTLRPSSDGPIQDGHGIVSFFRSLMF